MAAKASGKGTPSQGGRKTLRVVRLIVAGLGVLLLTGYILLATGLLGEIPGQFAGMLSSRGGVEITFRGLRTDLFWSTSADTVMVTDTTGVVVTVVGAEVEGSALSFLLSRHLKSLQIDSLDIFIPLPTEPSEPPMTLDSILLVTEESIVTGVDRLWLHSGRVHDPLGVIVNSMYLDTRVDRGGDGVLLSVDSASVLLPGFGTISLRGRTGLNAGLLTATDLTASAPPGELMVTGSFHCRSEAFDFSISGHAGTAFLELPLDLALPFTGTVTGTLTAPSATMSFNEGDASLFGRSAVVSADSVKADMAGITVQGLVITTDEASLSIDGDLDMETFSWNSEIELSMNGMDPSGVWDGLPAGSVTGTVRASEAGCSDTLLREASVSLHLEDSYLDDLRISTLELSGSVSPGWLSVDGSMNLENESVTFMCSGPLDDEMRPISLSASASASISSSSVFEQYGLLGLPEFRSVRMDVTGTGSAFDAAMIPGNWSAELELDVGSISGISTAGLGGLPGMTGTRLTLSGSGTTVEGRITPGVVELGLNTRMGRISLGGLRGMEGDPVVGSTIVSISGRASNFGPDMIPASWTARTSLVVSEITGNGLFGLAGLNRIREISLQADGSGSRFAASADGILSVDSVVFDGALMDSISVQGGITISRGSLSAQADLTIDSLRIGGDALRLDVGMNLADNDITADSLVVTASDGRLYSANIAVRTGLITRFSVGDMRASFSKHRMITDGALSGFTEGGVLVLDTLWLHPPVGILGMSGQLGPDSMALVMDVEQFDFSSFRSLIGLPADISGIGTFTLRLQRGLESVSGSLVGHIEDPSYGQFMMDSVTVDITTDETELTVNGLYMWLNGVRSGLQLRASGLWDAETLVFGNTVIEWMELEINDIGDWLFYALPLPFRTVGASISARVEYDRSASEGMELEFQASARIEKIFITILGIELPRVNFYLNYPDSSRSGYNTRLTLGAGDMEEGNFSLGCYASIENLYPLDIGDYDISVGLDRMEVPIPGIGAVVASGELSSSGTGTGERALLSGNIDLIEGAVGIPQASGSSSSSSSELPFDLAININGNSDLWFRTSFADIEMSVKIRVLTLERQPTVNGVVSAIRGRITLLQTDFDITEGRVELIQGIPPQMHLNVTAETTVRSLMNQEKYDISVRITGDVENPEVNLTGIGPSGTLSQEDILTLLAVGVTYGEMQQLNSSALRTEVENVAQSLVGNLLARSIRHEIGLDTFQISPELFADTTSLVLNVGKYVLPSVYVSYKGDVFSPSPGTFSLQYLFSSDLYIEGTTRSTIHGDMEPTVELHYTIRY